MQSGCLCCSLRGGLARPVSDLLERRRRGDLQFDRVVAETTGMADPGPVLPTLLVERDLARNWRMEGVVTIVDAVNAPNTLSAQFEATSQAAMADLIVLSKTDLVAKAAGEALEARLRGHNETAPIARQHDGPIAP